MILLTARTSRQDLVAGLEAGADDYLTKPFDPDELRARIHVGQRTLALIANIKRLSGLLPICSYCKRIRSDHELLGAGRKLHHRAHRRAVLARHLPDLLREGRQRVRSAADRRRDRDSMNLFRSRLRLRLLLVALIAVAPAIAAILVMQSLARQRSRESALADSLRLVRLAATQQASVLNGARLLLQTFAEFSPVRAIDPGACLDLLPRVLRGHAGYLALTVANTDGTIFCSTSPRDQLLHRRRARPRRGSTRVMQTRATAIGDYQLSAVTGTPAIVVAHPLLDPDGRVSRIVVALIDLAYLNTLMSGNILPPGATLTLFDRTGTILARVPGSAGRGSATGCPERRTLERLTAGASEVTSDSVGVDGVRRLYVTVPVRASIESGLYIGMGIDRDAAFRESDRIYRVVPVAARVRLADGSGRGRAEQPSVRAEAVAVAEGGGRSHRGRRPERARAAGRQRRRRQRAGRCRQRDGRRARHARA